MNDKIAMATMKEVSASLHTAREALNTRDIMSVSAAIERGITATSSLMGEKPQAQAGSSRPSRKKRKQSGSSNGATAKRGRVPMEQRREHIREALRNSERPLSTAEIAEAINASPSYARTVMSKMDEDLLEVASAHGTEPARFDLRERVSA